MDRDQFGYLGYLGDGVHLSHDDFQFWLSVSDPENYVVALEPSVAHQLIEAMVRHMFGENAPAYLRATADKLDVKPQGDI